jgi:biopolymer transport protein ExbB
MNLFAFIQATGQTLAQNTPAAAKKVAEMNYLEMYFKGGWVMYPITILSIIGTYIFIERYLALKKAAKEDTNFMSRIKDYIHEGKIESALNLCQSSDTPLARMIEKGVRRLGRPLSDINTAIENVGNLEVSKLEKGLPILASVAGGAPMLGFFGTVIGMVESFWHMNSAGNNIEISTMAGGIYTALITTVGGLMVGVPAYFAYNYLVTRVEKVVFKLEANTMEFMDILNEPANK